MAVKFVRFEKLIKDDFDAAEIADEYGEYEMIDDEECDITIESNIEATSITMKPSATEPPKPMEPKPTVVKCIEMKKVIILKEEEEYEYDNHDEDCEITEISTDSSSDDTKVTVKPPISKPGKNETKVKCSSIRSVVSLKNEDEYSEYVADDECDVTIESDTEVTSITMKPSPPVSNPSFNFPASENDLSQDSHL